MSVSLCASRSMARLLTSHANANGLRRFPLSLPQFHSQTFHSASAALLFSSNSVGAPSCRCAVVRSSCCVCVSRSSTLCSGTGRLSVSVSGTTPRRHFASKYPEHIVLSMPALSPTMTKGNLAAWKKKEGDKVKAGDVLADVETDKATVAFESVEEGYLAKILVQAGAQDVPCGVPVAVLCEEQSAVSAFKDYTAEGKAAPAPAAAAAAAPAAAPAAPSSGSAAKSPTSAPATPSTAQPAASGSDRVIASPLAKKTAAAEGVNLSEVKGTGPNQRIVAADVQEFKAARPAGAPTASATAPAAAAGGVPVAGVDYTDLPLSSMRKVIAERLTHSKNSLPHFYTTIDINMDRLLKLRQELNDSQPETASKISVNDFIIKAAALALRKVPAVNSGWIDGGNAIRQYAYVDISMAVATDSGLITPIIKDADLKGLSTIATEAKALAAKARANKLQLNEFQGGTFTISNLGMFGVKHFTAIINPPQSAILAVGSTESRVIVNPNKNDSEKFVSASFMSVTLSSDHRVVDGAVSAQYLAALKKLLENPNLMLL